MSLIPIASLANGTVYTTVPFVGPQNPTGAEFLTPAAGQQVHIYAHKTTTPATVYTDEAGLSPASQPLVSGADGGVPGFIDPATLPLDLVVNGQTYELAGASGGSGAVASVNSKTGAVVLTASDVGADASGAAATVQTALTAEVTRAQTAEALLIPLSQKAAASGVATLDGTTKIPSAQLPNGAVLLTSPPTYSRPGYGGSSWIAELPDAVDICAEFGVSTGATDNGPAINAALAALGPLGLTALIAKPGVYAIQTPVVIGNGTSSAVSTWTARLRGVGFPNWAVGVAAAAPGPVSTSLKWTGAGGVQAMVQVQGPLAGWSISNLLIDGGATPASAPIYGAAIYSAQYGVMENVAFQNSLGGLLCYANTIVAGVLCNTMHNQYRNLMVSWVASGVTASTGINLDCTTNQANTCFEEFLNTVIVIPTSSTGATHVGVNFRGCDSNTFRDLHFAGAPGGTDTKFWVRYNYNGPSNNWPSDNLIDKVDFSSNSANVITWTGTPLNLTSNPNRILNVGTENGAPAYAGVVSAVPHLVWDFPPMVMGTATLVAGTVTVSDSRIVAGSWVEVVNMGASGTVGALSVTVNAGNIVINSTSGTDTSKVLYKVYLVP